MDIALISSQQDPAGANIHRHVRDLLASGAAVSTSSSGASDIRWIHCEVEGRLIHQDGVDRDLDADLLIFLSRHTSAQPSPVLTVHVTGNFHEAALGGLPSSLAPAAPAWMQAVLRNLAVRAPPGYRVSYEVTHHGPTEISTPSFFVEIGSTVNEWTDPRAGEAAAASVLSAAPIDAIPLVGFGGTHYAARQTGIALATRGAFGHIAHTREVPALDAALLRQMVEASGAVAAYVDRKALPAAEYRHLRMLLDEARIPEVGESELVAIGSLAWGDYAAIQARAEALVPGGRAHPHALSSTGALVDVTLDPALLGEAIRADERGFLHALDNLPVAHITDTSGQIRPIFITQAVHFSKLINDLISLCVKLIIGCPNTAAEADRLIIRKVRFDPQKARNLGVPKGPLFGRLSGGQTIEWDGRIITPDLVQTCSTTEIHIPGLTRYL
jgi:D-aminoacyl-tRNA deacylase